MNLHQIYNLAPANGWSKQAIKPIDKQVSGFWIFNAFYHILIKKAGINKYVQVIVAFSAAPIQCYLIDIGQKCMWKIDL